MRIFNRIFRRNRSELISVFEEIIPFLEKYDNISWAGLSPAEAKMDLEIAIVFLNERKKIDKIYLKMLFETSGLIHICALENNWETEYLQIVNKFDRLIRN